jgi:excisionase family DNA binding protein
MNTSEQPGESLLTVNEALHRLKLGRTSLYREIEAGQIRVVKYGRKTMVPVSQVDQWIDRHLSAA